ncbi:MAG TPA: hypothetical protein V6D26_07260 [Stenomitos sp.]
MRGFQHPEGSTHHHSKAGAEVISRLAYAAIAHCGVRRPACRIDATLGAIGSNSHTQKAIANVNQSVVIIDAEASTLVSLFFAS